MKLEHRTVVNHYSKVIFKTENILIVMHQINEERLSFLIYRNEK